MGSITECCKYGIPLVNTISETGKRFESQDFLLSEIESTIKSAYSSKSNDSSNNLNDLSPLKRVEKYIEEKYVVRLNEVSGKVEFKNLHEDSPYKEVNEHSLIRELEHNNIKIGLPKLISLLQSDFVTVYNPFKDYFENLKPWDASTEIDFIDKVCDYIPVKDIDSFRVQFKKMLVRCIACSTIDHVFNKQVFVLIGASQNTGKSTFIRWLCPPVLGDYITEYVNTDKDGLIILSTNFIINLDELAALSKFELNSLKSLISKDKINVRLPYAKRTSVHPRRANFIGSTNNEEFLSDETGSVRYLCFEIEGKLNFVYKQDLDINDVWRQAFTLLLEGFEYQLTNTEIAEMEAANRKYLVISMEQQLIPKYFSKATKNDSKATFMDATDIMKHLHNHNGYFKTSVVQIGKAMKILGFEIATQYHPDIRQSTKGYYLIKNSI